MVHPRSHRKSVEDVKLDILSVMPAFIPAVILSVMYDLLAKLKEPSWHMSRQWSSKFLRAPERG